MNKQIKSTEWLFWLHLNEYSRVCMKLSGIEYVISRHAHTDAYNHSEQWAHTHTLSMMCAFDLTFRENFKSHKLENFQSSIQFLKISIATLHNSMRCEFDRKLTLFFTSSAMFVKLCHNLSYNPTSFDDFPRSEKTSLGNQLNNTCHPTATPTLADYSRYEINFFYHMRAWKIISAKIFSHLNWNGMLIISHVCFRKGTKRKFKLIIVHGFDYKKAKQCDEF